jgi:hypothetical protein
MKSDFLPWGASVINKRLRLGLVLSGFRHFKDVLASFSSDNAIDTIQWTVYLQNVSVSVLSNWSLSCTAEIL